MAMDYLTLSHVVKSMRAAVSLRFYRTARGVCRVPIWPAWLASYKPLARLVRSHQCAGPGKACITLQNFRMGA